MEYKDVVIRDFIESLASSAPAPGGGGASALMAAVGAALAGMVGSLTVGKKKYAAVEEEITELNGEMRLLYTRFLRLMDEDERVFLPLARAYGMPKDTPEQRAEKQRVMEAALSEAAGVPLEIMELCGRGIELLGIYEKKGSVLAVSDVGVAAAALRAGLTGASLNVFINTKAMCDRENAERLNERASSLLKSYTAMADGVFDSVRSRL